MLNTLTLFNSMENSPKLGGWRKDIDDSRDLKFSENLGNFTPIEDSSGVIDLRKWCPPVENQRNIGSCAANSVVSALEILQIKAGEPYRHLSRLFLYYNARLTDGDPEKDVGTYLRTAYATLTGMGTCTEAAWPYDTDNVFLRPSWDAYRDAYPNKINSYYRIAAYGKDLRDAIVRALEAQHPVSFGMIIDRDFMQNTDCDGVVAMPKETRAQCGGHAMLIVGCKDYGNTLIVRNSWGTGWGDQGYCYVPFAYLEESSADDFWVPFALKTV